MNIKKQALAVVAGPYRFYQILWLYTQFTEYQWSILLLPYGNNSRVIMDIHSKCVQLGIFKNIYHSSMVGQNSGKGEQICIILQMLLYFIVGKRKNLMKKIIFSQTQYQEFDAYFIGCEYSIIEGAIIGISDEKDVYIFEEGLGDYLTRKKYPSLSLKEILCFIVCKMGYFSPHTYFELKKINHCTKYASLPELLSDRKFKSVIQLFEGDGISKQKYKNILNTIYSFSYEVIKECDVVFFTSPWDWDIDKKNEYFEKMHKWMKEKYKGKKICIKRHPRDNENYLWADLDCIFLEDHVPAEILVNEIKKNQEVIMMGTSTILLSILSKTDNINIFRFKSIHGEYERYIDEKVSLLKLEKNVIDL